MKTSTEILELVVDGSGIRLDKYIAERCELSRSHIQKLIAEERVLLNGRAVKASQKVTSGERIVVAVPPPTPISVAPEDIPLDIVYEDDYVMVIDKPAGLTVHPAPGHRSGTLVNAILAHCPDLMTIKGSVRPGIVHRLDKDTSGLMMVAKNDAAQMSLSGQIKRRAIKKGYLALVSGHLSPAQGTIEAPIGRHPRDRKRMAVISTGREARTFYKVKEYLQSYSLLEVHTETGRTHQIRVHLSSIGHPVVGDAVYGKRSDLLGRQFLHAHRLGFRLPSSGDFVEFESALPLDLQEALKQIAS
ncbi:MAG: RluA family pseudouridine synthase [Dehalococcoidia bacterium]|nr:Ribosomal large subunit pseudouridine synthase D [Chloroflexota bacterium]MBT9162945.1 Ribosomal large subunit pseudouridine synthase D [Chloroflexota bacterium]